MSRRHAGPIDAAEALIIFGIILIVHSLKQIKKKTSLQNMGKQLVSSASAGSIELECVAWPLGPVESSMNNHPAVYRHVTVQKYIKQNRSSHWKTVWQKSSPSEFLVFDHSGFIKIDTSTVDQNADANDGITSLTYPANKLSSSQLDSFCNIYDNSVAGLDVGVDKGFFSSFFSLGPQFRILEKAIPVGTPLLIQGYFTPLDHFSYIALKEEFRLFKERADKLVSNRNYRLSLLDKDKNGRVDTKEMYDGFQAALKNSVKANFTPTQFKNEGSSHEKLYGTISNGPGQPLSMNECFQEQILNSRPVYLNWLGLYLGAGLVAAGIIVLVIFFKL
jgi:hypothetical protein